MTSLLHITSSLFDAADKQGVSTQLSHELIAGLRAANPDLQLRSRDFAQTPIPYLDNAWLGALFTPAAERNDEQAQKVAFSDALIVELKAAEVLVIGVPTYNFSVPAMLRSWADHVARAGVTFKYTDKGAVGLTGSKKVYLVIASGGIHEEGGTDHVRPWLRTFLGFLGMNDLEFIVAGGLNMGESARAQGLQNARTKIAALLTAAAQEN
jgi:FMN-dependent NADH-azoreductase